MIYESYDAGGNFIGNDIWRVALDYLDAAQAEFERETSRVGFWRMGHWYVVHHLSVISCELFLKSFIVTVNVLTERDEDGYADTKTESKLDKMHKIAFEKLGPIAASILQSCLTPEQLSMIRSEMGCAEITRGRYPHESGFPPCEEGRLLAERWLNLAKSLSVAGDEIANRTF